MIGYNIHLNGLNDEQREQVQQKFFDLGIPWSTGPDIHYHPEALEYTNIKSYGTIDENLMYGNDIRDMGEATHTFEEFMALNREQVEPTSVHTFSNAEVGDKVYNLKAPVFWCDLTK